MRIDLGRGDISVTQQRLYHPKIGSVVQKMAGEGMAQHVRAHLAESRRGGKRLEVAGKMLARQGPRLAEGGKKPFRLPARIRRPQKQQELVHVSLARLVYWPPTLLA